VFYDRCSKVCGVLLGVDHVWAGPWRKRDEGPGRWVGLLKTRRGGVDDV
jgi:hypothetical protein